MDARQVTSREATRGERGVLDKTDPDATTITFADGGWLVVEDADALEQYRYASELLPLAGERSAAVTTSRAAASSAVANQFATYLRQMEKFESLAENRTLVAKMAETRIEAEVLGRKRALEAAEDLLAALTQRPTRRGTRRWRRRRWCTARGCRTRWTSDAAGGWTDHWRGVRRRQAAGRVLRGDAQPQGLRNMMELELWELARQAARTRSRPRGRSGRRRTTLFEIVAEAGEEDGGGGGVEGRRGRARRQVLAEKMREQLQAPGAENPARGDPPGPPRRAVTRSFDRVVSS